MRDCLALVSMAAVQYRSVLSKRGGQTLLKQETQNGGFGKKAFIVTCLFHYFGKTSTIGPKSKVYSPRGGAKHCKSILKLCLM